MKEKKEINIYIGNEIRTAREKAGLTQAEFGEIMFLDTKNVSDIERGVTGIKIATLKRICEGLSVSSDSLLFGDQSKNDIKTWVGRQRRSLLFLVFRHNLSRKPKGGNHKNSAKRLRWTGPWFRCFMGIHQKGGRKGKIPCIFYILPGTVSRRETDAKAPSEDFSLRAEKWQKNAARTPSGTDCGKTDLIRQTVCFSTSSICKNR